MHEYYNIILIIYRINHSKLNLTYRIFLFFFFLISLAFPVRICETENLTKADENISKK